MPKISAPAFRAIWVAAMQPAEHVQGRVRRGVVDHEPCPLRETQPVGQREHAGLGHRDDLGLAAELRPGHHPLTAADPGDRCPDVGDLARHLVAEHARRLRRVGVEPGAGHGVGEVDPGRPDGDLHLVIADRRLRSLLHLEHLRSPDPGLHHGSHTGDLNLGVERRHI